MCEECPVREPCLEDDLEYVASRTGQEGRAEFVGMRGGLTPGERWRLSRRRRREAAERREVGCFF